MRQGLVLLEVPHEDRNVDRKYQTHYQNRNGDIDIEEGSTRKLRHAPYARKKREWKEDGRDNRQKASIRSLLRIFHVELEFRQVFETLNEEVELDVRLEKVIVRIVNTCVSGFAASSTFKVMAVWIVYAEDVPNFHQSFK